MSPLELEIYHQMRNVIGIDPAFYEYIFTVDADTVCYFMIFITHLLISFWGCLDCYTRLSQSFGRFQCRRLQDYWHMWRNQTHERRRLVVDYDSSLRILYLPPSIQSFRESFRICHLSTWLL